MPVSRLWVCRPSKASPGDFAVYAHSSVLSDGVSVAPAPNTVAKRCRAVRALTPSALAQLELAVDRGFSFDAHPVRVGFCVLQLY